MKIVLDTNVFVSSFFGGNPRRIIQLWEEGSLTLCLSGAILDEYLQVVVRLGLRTGAELEEMVGVLKHAPNVLFVAEPKPVKVVADDPDDDKFIACAVESGARFVVSGDKHLLGIRRYYEIQVMSPQEFLTQAAKPEP
jgi:putative PIN family toxin of toxin-antitoxin system